MLLNWKKVEKPRVTMAQSWSIDRIEKKSDAYVQYSRFASPEYKALRCPACGSDQRKEHALTVGGVKFFVCHQCGTHVSDSGPRARIKTKCTLDELRHYLCVAADIEQAVRDTVHSLGNRQGGEFLDLNCGLGFTVDAVRRRPGWSANGVEYGPLAAFAKEWLGCSVYTNLSAISADPSNQKFDVVLSRAQLNQTLEPLGFINDTLALLKENGSLVFVLPSAEAIYQIDNNYLVSQHLMAGECFFIPTKEGLFALFERAGLQKPELRIDGNQIYVTLNFAGRLNSPGESPSSSVYLDYLLRCAQDLSENKFSIIAAQRLFIEHIDNGNYGDATAAREILKSYIDYLEENVVRFEKNKNVQVPVKGVLPNAGRLLYCEAMLALNYVSDVKRAASLFSLASRYARKFHSLSEEAYPDQLELAGCCDYHELICLARDHRAGEANQRREEIKKNYTVEPWLSQIQNLQLDVEK